MATDFSKYGKIVGSDTEKTSNGFSKYGTPVSSITKKQEEKKKTTGQKILDIGTGVTNFLGGKNVAETFGSEIAKIGKTKQEKDIISAGQPGVKETIGSALQLGSTFIPGATGAGLARKIGTSAATGYAIDVGSKLQKEDTSIKDALKPGTATAVSVALPVITNIFGKAFSKAPSAIETLNQRLSPTEKKLLGSKGKEVSKYILDKRIAGTPEQRFIKISDLADDFERKVVKVVDGAKKTYPKSSIIESLNKIKDKYLDNPPEYNSVSSKIDTITDFLQTKKADSITASQLNKFKRSFWDAAYNEKGNKIVSDSLHDAGSVMKKILDDSIVGLEKINREYGTILTAKRLLDTARTRSQSGLLEKAAGLVAGTSVGGALGGAGGAGLGAFVGPKIVEQSITPIRSATALGLNEINNLIQKIPVDKAGNLQISKKALLQLLVRE